MSDRTSTHGAPCWYELMTPNVDEAARFYGDVLRWTFTDSGMEEMEYRLAGPEAMVAGMMALNDVGGGPTMWLYYVAVDDCDASVAAATAAGGAVAAPAQSVPGVGRFAVITDPQGAAIGLLQPDTPETPEMAHAFDPQRPGHAAWHELMSSDPVAGLAFYADLFGWTAGDAMDMGEMGTYQLFRHGGSEIGGMMGLGNAPVPAWMVYFGVEAVEAAMARITAAGGTVLHGPMEVPGGAVIAVAQDPQGAAFAVLGPR